MATFVIEQSSDDCYRALITDYWNLASSNIAAGYQSKTVYQLGSGMRFNNITIPQGATITSAYLHLYSHLETGDEVVNSRISAEDVDNAITFADDKVAFDARWANRTTARVDFDDIDHWYPGQWNHSPEIKTVIQEIVSRLGWVSGNSIVIFWEDFEGRSVPTWPAFPPGRYANSYDRNPDYAPQLVITVATAPTVTTEPATGISSNKATLNGVLNDDGGEACECGFEWGETPAYGNTTPTQSRTAGQTFQQTISGLVPGKTYHFRAFATNSAGTGYGADRSFTISIRINKAYALAREEL